MNRLACWRTPTEDYPEEKFINQLIYLVLMHLGDAQEPDEKYCLDYTERTYILTELQNITLSTNPASDTIQRSLAHQLRIMHTVHDYPLLDPQSNRSLSERKNLTRRALLIALKDAPLEAPVPAPKLRRNGQQHGQAIAPEALSDEERAAMEAMLSNMIFP